MKYYTDTQISKKFTALTKDKKIEILLGALDFMQQYNGRSKFMCIAMAMGFENVQGEKNTYFIPV